jgi:DNA-binding transcriptional LysR family regulator
VRFDLLTIELFIAICDAASIAKAAEQKNIAASAVSKRISDLEAKLETSLFHRGVKGLELTPAGHTFLYHSRSILRDLRQMELGLAHHGKGLSGQVRVFGSVSTIIQHLPSDLREFLLLHPSIRVELEEGTSKQAVDAVAENAADIGVFGGVMPRPGLRIFPYRTDRLAVLAPAGHAFVGRESIRFDELVGHQMVGPMQGSFLDSIVMRAAADLNKPLTMPIRVNGFETVAAMVEAELGVGLVPEACGARYVGGGKVYMCMLDEPWATRQWNICVQENNTQPSVEMLVNFLRRSIPA